MPHAPAVHRALALALALLAAPSASAAPPDPGARLAAAARAFEALEQRTIDALAKELDRLVGEPALAAAFEARDRDGLLAAARPHFERLAKRYGLSHFYFLEPEPGRACFLRVHKPSLFGDVVDRVTFTQAIESKRMGAGKELGKTAFALRVVKPMRRAGRLVGYVELGEDIDHFVERAKQETGDDYGVLVDKALVDRAELARVRNDDRWDERPDVVLVVSTMWDEKQVDVGGPLAKLEEKGTPVRTWTEAGRTWAGAAYPLHDAARKLIGALYVRHAVEAR